jgi:metal-dependent hydrolase (beta-lactamase superfamily II)
MLWLNVIQAEFGDALLLEHKPTGGTTHWYLVDGGPGGNYADNLKGVLEGVAQKGGSLDAVVLSHVDNDHVLGLIDLFNDLLQAQVAGTAPVIGVTELWHNSFELVPGAPAVENDVKAAFATAGASGASMETMGASVLGQGEGFQLRLKALQLGLTPNQPFPNHEIRIETAPVIQRNGLTLRVVGPSEPNLQNLRDDWVIWLQDHEPEIASGSPLAAASADGSIPNLSSVCLLVTEGTHSALLTGDARGDHILTNLEALKVIPKGGTLHVDLLKMPHHGSDRNSDPKFFERLTADRYVFSANGKDGNPDTATLIWLAEALKKQNRKAKIFVTNRTPSTDKFKSLYPAATYGYTLTILPTTERVARLKIG